MSELDTIYLSTTLSPPVVRAGIPTEQHRALKHMDWASQSLNGVAYPIRFSQVGTQQPVR